MKSDSDYKYSELSPELYGFHSLNFSVPYDSSARSVMFSSHFSQHLTIDGATEKRIQTGAEIELAKYTFSVKMPEDGTILKVIERYPRTLDGDSIRENPETLVIYEDRNTHELGCFSIPTFASYHQYFGFKYKLTQACNLLTPGTKIDKGTVFADTPAVSENGGYMYGTEMNIAFMSHPSVAEDGIMISRDVLPRLKFRLYERRSVEFGNNYFPLNMYGRTGEYKPFPDIGDRIRDHGILAMLRPYDSSLTPVEMSIYDVMEPDFIFDKPVYVRGKGGKVVDIKVFKDNQEVSGVPTGIMEGMEKYPAALRRYYRDILNFEKGLAMENLKKGYSGKLALKPEFHRLMVEAMAVLGEPIPKSYQAREIRESKSQPRLNLMYRKAPIDNYRIEFTIEYEITPVEGFKLTDSHGCKGVICKIEEPENMPVDAKGRRADIVMDSNSIIARMCIGRPYETYFGAGCLDVSDDVRANLNIPKQSAKKALKLLKQYSDEQLEWSKQHILKFLGCITPIQQDYYARLNREQWLDVLANVIQDGIRLGIRTDNPISLDDAVVNVENNFKLCYGPVTYRDLSGRLVTTVDPVRIQPIYLMLLEKISDDWSSVSSGKQQHFGVLSPSTRSEKFSYPWRNSPVRTIGETEGRIFAAYCGRECIAEMMDRSNNPLTHKNEVWNILSADNPMNIDEVVDRNIVPLGNGKQNQLVEHILMVAGIRIEYVKPK
jgi:hypothetical protein